jgi:hypothetical protein
MRIGRVTNISLSGALIATPFISRVLSRIQVIWSWPAGPVNDLAAVAACVVRETLDGIAVEWCEFAPSSVVQIIQAAESYSVALAVWSPRAVAKRA